jgi:predicted MFS family arabinose efflux permease
LHTSSLNVTPTQTPSVGVVLALGATQTLAWGSSYYLVAILAAPIARDLQISTTWVFAAFSVALVVSGLVGPRVGRMIDRHGGRDVLVVSNVVFAAGLVLLGLAHDPWLSAAAWLIIGFGMGLGLYDAAFATLGRLYGTAARSSITGIALMAGFASTIAWPLTAWGDATIGWRATCFAWALVHVGLALPINRFCIPKPQLLNTTSSARDPAPKLVIDRTMWLLGGAFAMIWFIATAMATHLPRILEAVGLTPVEAIAAAALMGPAQVAARMIEAGPLSRFHPLVSARIAALTHPIAAVLMLIGGAPFAWAFAIIHGAGNGILTIARGTVPLAIYGSVDYGYRLGLLGAPARFAQALAPVAGSLLIEAYGVKVLAASAVLGALTFSVFCLVKPKP